MSQLSNRERPAYGSRVKPQWQIIIDTLVADYHGGNIKGALNYLLWGSWVLDNDTRNFFLYKLGKPVWDLPKLNKDSSEMFRYASDAFDRHLKKKILDEPLGTKKYGL